jgi:hypothetical protein
MVASDDQLGNRRQCESGEQRSSKTSRYLQLFGVVDWALYLPHLARGGFSHGNVAGLRSAIVFFVAPPATKGRWFRPIGNGRYGLRRWRRGLARWIWLFARAIYRQGAMISRIHGNTSMPNSPKTVDQPEVLVLELRFRQDDRHSFGCCS